MTTINEFYTEAELALAAYAKLHQEISEQDYITALQDGDKGMSYTQAKHFAFNYSVVDQ